jgi:hypothetical protein
LLILKHLNKRISLNSGHKKLIEGATSEGLKFYKDYNNSRLVFSFSTFTQDMKKALFEIIYFLHVNDPKFEEHEYKAVTIEEIDGVLKEKQTATKARLYIKDAPFGVMGIEDLSEIFKQEFYEFVKNELKSDIPIKIDDAPICSISSVGSIGTIGYKKTDSDLDLQIQYELNPFLIDPEQISDYYLKKFSLKLIKYFTRRLIVKNKWSKDDLKDKKQLALAISVGESEFKKRFPVIFGSVIKKSMGVFNKLMGNPKIHKRFLHELINIYKLHRTLINRPSLLLREKLLKEKIGNIQDYVQKKYPNAEVYLFAYSAEDFRKGKHGSTLESKEASGSAYELILNFETLLPGVQFLPTFPAHFLVPTVFNANPKSYERILEYVQFDMIGDYKTLCENLTDLGASPNISFDYLIAHSGAIYWEGFKASSGNLPKALLNILRFEMLFIPEFNISVMELIKDPGQLNKFINTTQEGGVSGDEEENSVDKTDDGAQAEVAEGMSTQLLHEIEGIFPLLKRDPWWLRYKALKIAFNPGNKLIESEDELKTLSRMIDICFALHIKLSDIFTESEKLIDTSNHREPFLKQFLEKAFPGERGVFMRQIFIGEVKSVKSFEKILKTLFINSMERIKKIVEASEGEDKTNRKELKIWKHYFNRNFEPAVDMVRQDILTHLKTPRDRIQIGYSSNKKWFFKAIQKRIQTDAQHYIDGSMLFMPDEVELIEHESMLHGIAYCVLNKYYGFLHKGTLKEVKTQIEFSIANTSIGKKSADEFAYLRPDNIERLIDRINKEFPVIPFSYKSILTEKKRITDVFVFLNLLEFGRISFLFQDNFKVWCVVEIDHPEIEKKYQAYYDQSDSFLDLKTFQETIKKFLTRIEFVVNEETIDNIFFWVNPNSIKTSHSNFKQKEKEAELVSRFTKSVLQAIYVK